MVYLGHKSSRMAIRRPMVARISSKREKIFDYQDQVVAGEGREGFLSRGGKTMTGRKGKLAAAEASEE